MQKKKFTQSGEKISSDAYTAPSAILMMVDFLKDTVLLPTFLPLPEL